jgi:predicted kinase
MPSLFLTVGLPASGKSSWAKSKVEHNAKTARVNYDDIRKMMGGTPPEAAVQEAAKAAVRQLLAKGWNVIVDNTNLTDSAKARWTEIAAQGKAKLEVVDFLKVPVETCVERDNIRLHDRVSPPVIWTMALKAGLLRFSDKQKVLVDVDGTLACHDGIRSPYDETLVHLDTEYSVVHQWVKNMATWNGYCMDCFLFIATPETDETDIDIRFCKCAEPKLVPKYEIIIVSGRSTACALSTYKWLYSRNIPFSYIFMRNRGDHRPDVIVKQEFLDAMLKYFPKEQIAFALDDRPCVVKEVWRKNGITVFPVRGELEDF